MAEEIEVRTPSEEELEEKEVRSWPTWEKEASEFNWYYDEKEICYLVEGEVEVETETGTVEFAAGDMVTFPRGLECRWNIKEDVKKHYQLG